MRIPERVIIKELVMGANRSIRRVDTSIYNRFKRKISDKRLTLRENLNGLGCGRARWGGIRWDWVAWEWGGEEKGRGSIPHQSRLRILEYFF